MRTQSITFRLCRLACTLCVIFFLYSIFLSEFFSEDNSWFLEFLAFLIKLKVIWSHFENHRLKWLKSACICLTVECANRSVSAVDKLVIAFACFSLFNGLLQPLSKFQMLCIHGGIETELELVLACPELFRRETLDFLAIVCQMLLMLVVEIGIIWTVKCGIAVFIEQIT